MKLHTNPAIFSELLTNTSVYTGIQERFVEKDYWLTMVLKNLSQSHHASIAVFKGGTSLSKVYQIVERFSEDVDLALIVEDLTNNQVKSRMDSISKSITRDLPEVRIEKVTSKGSRFRRTAHEYPITVVAPLTASQVRQQLILEVNAFANPYPFEQQKVSAMIADYLKQANRQDLIEQFELEAFALQVLKPNRTLAEKVLALARASYAVDPVDQLRQKIRHTYDLHFLLKQPELRVFVESEEFFSTLASVQAEDANNTEFQGAWAKQPLTSAIIYQDKPELWTQLESTYMGSFKSMVYGHLPSIQEVQESFFYLSGILRRFDDLRVDIHA